MWCLTLFSHRLFKGSTCLFDPSSSNTGWHTIQWINIIYCLIQWISFRETISIYSLDDIIVLSTFWTTGAWSPGGVLGISSDGDDRRIVLGLKFLILGSLIWVVKSFILFLPELVLFRVIHNVTVETKPFLGVSSTRSSLLKWLPDEGKDIFRWYDE